jgi:hypothetical protein
MKARPIKHYSAPRYPARLLVVSNPSLLHDHQPPAWRARGMAGAAAVLITAGLAVAAADQGKAPDKATIAPIFVHGEGRGDVLGPRAMVAGRPSTPMFLSEEEALVIIIEELSKTSLTFTQKDVEWKEVKIPQTERRYADGKESLVELPGKVLVVDREDPVKHVAVEFITSSDYFDKGGTHDTSPIQPYDFPRAAQTVADKVKDKGPAVYFGVFYDPMNTYNETIIEVNTPACFGKKGFSDELPGCQEQLTKNRAEAIAQATAQSKDQLRLQVQDFVQWLKAQGAI